MSFAESVTKNTSLTSAIGDDDAYLVSAIGLYTEQADLTSLAAEGLTDGSNDKKIDFIYLDRDGRRIVLAQGYMSKKKNDSAPANKASDLNTACAWIISGDISLVPEKLRGIVLDCRAAISEGEIDYIDLLYVHNLPESINVARELQTVEEHLRTALSGNRLLIRAIELGSSKIEHLFSAHDSHIAITEEVLVPRAIQVSEAGGKWKAAVTSVPGQWLHMLYLKYGEKLYSANYRGFLGADGRKRVNSGIRETIEKNPKDFWAFNNGVTILTQAIGEARKGANTPLQGISIINGAQTSGTIGSTDALRFDLSDLNVLCRIIECSDQDTIEDIVRFNNTQNAITTWDRFSNDQDQKRISDEFDELGYFYNRKRGFSGNGDQIGIEQVLQPLLAFHGRPADAVRGKNQLFLQTPIYRNAFENKKARHILFVYALSRAIDEKRLSLKLKASNEKLIDIEQKQLDLLKNLNFKPFLVCVIANSLDVIIGRPVDVLTVGFKSDYAKSSQLTELAARWLPVVEAILPLLTTKAKPDTFFKSLTAEGTYLAEIKDTIDAMLVTTGATERFKSFAEIVSTS